MSREIFIHRMNVFTYHAMGDTPVICCATKHYEQNIALELYLLLNKEYTEYGMISEVDF